MGVRRKFKQIIIAKFAIYKFFKNKKNIIKNSKNKKINRYINFSSEYKIEILKLKNNKKLIKNKEINFTGRDKKKRLILFVVSILYYSPY
jgi:hypothetical protein